MRKLSTATGESSWDSTDEDEWLWGDMEGASADED